jgi:hypothetical protein
MKNKRQDYATAVTSAVPPRSGLVQLLSEPPQAATITGQLIPATPRGIKVKIVCNIHRLTQLVNNCVFRQKPTGTAAYLPNDRRLISVRARTIFVGR